MSRELQRRHDIGAPSAGYLQQLIRREAALAAAERAPRHRPMTFYGFVLALVSVILSAGTVIWAVDKALSLMERSAERSHEVAMAAVDALARSNEAASRAAAGGWNDMHSFGLFVVILLAAILLAAKSSGKV